MTDDPEPTEQTTPARRVSRNAGVDREVREQRRELIGTLLLSKVSYRKMVDHIRERLGYEVSTGTIASDVAVLRNRWLARMTESYGGHVAEQMAYYDGLLRALTPRALQGEHNAVTDLLAVLDRRARLVGMEQPDRILVGVGAVSVDSVSEKWSSAPREEQLARTEQIMAILAEAGPLRLDGGPALQNSEPNGGGDVIELADYTEPDE